MSFVMTHSFNAVNAMLNAVNVMLEIYKGTCVHRLSS